MNRIRPTVIAFAMAVVCLSATVALADSWNYWGRDLNNSSYDKDEKGITAANVGNLKVKWVFDLAADGGADCASNRDGCSSYVTPTVSDGSVYFTDYAGNLYSVDTATGKLNWRQQISRYTGTRNDFSRNSPAIASDTLYFGSYVTATVIAVDRADGSLKWKQSVDSHPLAHITASLVVFGDTVYVGVASSSERAAIRMGLRDIWRTFRGSVSALDAKNGAVKWRTDMIPPPPAGTHPIDWFSGSAVWGSSFPIDAPRDAIYVSTGNNYHATAALKNCVDAFPGIAPVNPSRKMKDHIQICLADHDDPDNYVDSILSLNLGSGEVNWATKLVGYDPWTVPCVYGSNRRNCPVPTGPDYDFGQAPMLWSAVIDGKEHDFVGAGAKRGTFWALNRDNGTVVWSNQGVGGTTGGSQWGSATDGNTIFTANTVGRTPPSPPTWPAGFWRAIDAATGATLWQKDGPVGTATACIRCNAAYGALSATNDVVFAGSLAVGVDNMLALDAKTGATLWSHEAPGSVASGPSIVDGVVYWTTGYHGLFRTTKGQLLYAFELP